MCHVSEIRLRQRGSIKCFLYTGLGSPPGSHDQQTTSSLQWDMGCNWRVPTGEQHDIHPVLQLRLWALNGAGAATSWPWLRMSHSSLYRRVESQIRNTVLEDLISKKPQRSSNPFPQCAAEKTELPGTPHIRVWLSQSQVQPAALFLEPCRFSASLGQTTMPTNLDHTGRWGL